MKRIHTYSLALMSALMVTVLASSVQADTYQHVESVARKVARKSRALAGAVNHYRHTPEYIQLIEDTQQMAATAEHIVHWADLRGELNHLVADINELDRLYHHAERLFNRVEAAAAGGHGHVHGNTAYVRRLLDDIADAIHHLQEDAQILRATAHGHHGGHYIPYEPPIITPAPRCGTGGGYDRPYGGRGYSIDPGGISFGNSGFQFRIKF